MRLPLRQSIQTPLRRLTAAAAIGAAAGALAMLLYHLPPASMPLHRLDDVLYDSLYHFRDFEDRAQSDVVIVAVDDRSLDAVDRELHFGWPWPRDLWATAIGYLDRCGARAIAFDMLFAERSVYANTYDDDNTLAAAINGSRAPVILAASVARDSDMVKLSPPVISPIFGAVAVGSSDVFRRYNLHEWGRPTLGARVVDLLSHPATCAATQTTQPSSRRQFAASPGAPDANDDSFLLHYYGPYQTADGRHTHRYISAASVIGAGANPAQEAQFGLSAADFRGKIVLIGAISVGTFDVKASPLSAQYPGVEVHATAIENLLRHQRVREISPAGTALAAVLGAMIAAVGVLLPRRMSLKLACAAAAFALLGAVCIILFRGNQIRWLPAAAPLLAAILAVVGGLGWSYLAEDRQRRLIFKALSQYVSPHVASQLARDPTRLTLGGRRREMSVMFTDIADFTTISEKLDVERLGAMLNFYLDEMSGVILQQNGTLDKYIGDAIMSFWNAPLDQADHAVLACRAALAMADRERQIAPQLAELGAPGMTTRIGISSGPMVCGNMGSTRKFNYTVMGDTVNLASRLEGANKFYGTRILISQPTAELVANGFVLRRVDVLRVKGRREPMSVYELIAEGRADDLQARRVAAYDAAFASYQAQKWDDAERLWLEILQSFPEDNPSRTMLSRVARFRREPPPDDWDGVYVAREK